ncbi:gp41 [Orgyia leucostigma nucleopolyhedrovirus]|uniref:Gp41 n=1 Tax=Orgyia leucostigma nucleopolyhedrovirus TaxID=490711 RepID=B0FDU0_9ABAC|nr:gp41 [Orgyia leucostigma nucleopolyhedrovirus]ABY65798.1 gp41 [Orgyia leucostigma nucleopolyhedrovirus]
MHNRKSSSPTPPYDYAESYLSRDSVVVGGAHNDRRRSQDSYDHRHYHQNHPQQQQQQHRYYRNDNNAANDYHATPNVHYAAGALTGYSASTTERNVWTDKCVDLNQIIRYFRTNDYSGFDNETRLLVNTIRDICIDTSPLDVNVVKRFDNDESLMKNYERLVKDNGGSVVPSNIFVQSFIDHVLPSYAQKFYNKGGITVSDDSKAEAAYQLGLAVKYQVAQAVTSSIPIPLPFNQQLANNYMTLLLKQAQIPPNVQTAVQSRRYAQLNNINDLINNVITNLFAGGNDYYYYVLNETNRARIISLKENLTYLGSLSETANVFEFIAELATRKGKQPGLFREAHNITSSNNRHRTIVGGNANAMQTDKEAALHEHYRRSLTEMAFQNEALRRFIFQELSYKRNLQNS